ncbi:DUF434 domain-containing protein [Thermogutta sp.]|uniref:DUF434 domain-containing protein n=1 Tax=Thermogutta sp. TaxID=1962930 RepID=UPI003C7D5023
MPDRRQHRGPHPEDHELFAPSQYPRLQTAFCDLCWLLDRGYALPSSLKLVGDRYQLAARQRMALERSACTWEDLLKRRSRQQELQTLHGAPLYLDGYNVLTTMEAALAGGVLIRGRDGTLRDMASMHGSYRKVQETVAAIRLIGKGLAELGVSTAHWYLDKPVSNSGRLAKLIRELATEHGWPWQVEIVQSPDYVLMECPGLVATADSVILDYCQRWVNLTDWLVVRYVPTAWVIDFSRIPHDDENKSGQESSANHSAS